MLACAIPCLTMSWHLPSLGPQFLLKELDPDLDGLFFRRVPWRCQNSHEGSCALQCGRQRGEVGRGPGELRAGDGGKLGARATFLEGFADTAPVAE